MSDKIIAGSQQPSRVERMKMELDNLKENLEKLSAFVDGDKFHGLQEEAREDLLLQRKAMTDYAFILSKRYDDAVSDGEK